MWGGRGRGSTEVDLVVEVATRLACMGSELGLVGPVPVYCHWARRQICLSSHNQSTQIGGEMHRIWCSDSSL